MSLKDFIILAKLGEGAYSSVYKVQRIIDNEIYALKKVKMNNLSSKQQENALNEVRILASVYSPFIIQYKHSFIEGGSLCIVMEYSDDGDLYQKIVQTQKNGETIDEAQIWKTLIYIGLGLKKLHQFNILHRDLKSANVFLDKSGAAKLGDMNVSKIAKNGLLYTQTGTPYYASPEVWKDKPYDSKSDIWSLGCVIYQMTTLKPPFRAEDMDGLYKKIIKGTYPKIGDGYSKQLASVIKSMLQVNPSNRPNASQLLQTLEPQAEEMGIDFEDEMTNKNQLLKTIRVQKNLHSLTDRLPKSNYNNGHQIEAKKINTTNKFKSPGLANYPPQIKHHINLPKLDRLIVKNNLNNIYKMSDDSHKKMEIGGILRVEGKANNHHNYKKHEDEEKKYGDRDIKAQLRKIYNIRPSPKKVGRRIVELPRIK